MDSNKEPFPDYSTNQRKERSILGRQASSFETFLHAPNMRFKTFSLVQQTLILGSVVT
jgi:hypothetical protein